MRKVLEPWVEKSRVAGEKNSGPHGAFEMTTGPTGMALRVIASDGRDWNEAGLEGEPWEHVSVSLRMRTPTWAELEFVKHAFWKDDETVIQLHVPKAKHINVHRFVLHLWRPTVSAIPLPPKITV